MRFDQHKAFPYPVLRTSSDDYIDGAFQAAVLADIRSDSQGLNLSVSGSFNLSIDEIQDLIDKKLAQYSIIIDCRDTFTRKHIATFDNTFNVTFEPGELEGEFTISTSIIAIKDITDFSSKYLHQDFGNDGINFEEGSLLAQADDQTHFITRDYFKPLTSIFQFDVDSAFQNNMFSINLTEEKISITLNNELMNVINRAKASGKYGPIIFNSFYLPCLIRVLSVMDDEEQRQEYSSRQWFNVVEQKLNDLKINRPIKDTALVAQQLFKSPIESLVTMFTKLDEASQV